MFEPTEHEVDQDVRESMEMFQRAKIGEVPPIQPREIQRLLLVVDGSTQDALGIDVSRRWKARFACPLDVLDAREHVSANGLAENVAQSLDARALTKPAGDSFEQVLEAVRQTSYDLVIIPSPYGRDLDKVGSDSTGTVIDVLLSRCPVPLLVTRRPFAVDYEPFARVLLVVISETEAEGRAAEWSTTLVAPGGRVELLVVVEDEVVENVRKLMHEIEPEMEIDAEQLSRALERSHVRLHRALQKASRMADFRYELVVQREVDGPLSNLTDEHDHPLLVFALEQADHLTQGLVHDRIRRTPHSVLVVPDS